MDSKGIRFLKISHNKPLSVQKEEKPKKHKPVILHGKKQKKEKKNGRGGK